MGNSGELVIGNGDRSGMEENGSMALSYVPRWFYLENFIEVIEMKLLMGGHGVLELLELTDLFLSCRHLISRGSRIENVARDKRHPRSLRR